MDMHIQTITRIPTRLITAQCHNCQSTYTTAVKMDITQVGLQTFSRKDSMREKFCGSEGVKHSLVLQFTVTCI